MVQSRGVLGAAAAVVALVSLAGCGGGSEAGASAPRSTVASSTTTSAPSPTASTTSPAVVRRIAVVSDSEITEEIVRALDAEADLEVVFHLNAPGARLGDLDVVIGPALDEHPDAFVFAGGANDVGPLGTQGMLDALRQRIDRISAATCLVYAVPTVDTTTLPAKDRATATAVLDGFDAVLREWKVRTVPYGEIAREMADEGRSFFLDGEVGSIHPGPAAYPRIAARMAEQVRTCP